MAGQTDSQTVLPRIVPTPDHIKALVGTWAFDGRLIQLHREPQSGVLLAKSHEGQQVNPLKVISRGKKLSDADYS